MKTAPHEKEPTNKVVGRTTYHSCVNPKYCTHHSSTDYKGVKITSEGNKAHWKDSSTEKIDSDSLPNKLLDATNACVSLLDNDDYLE